MLDYFGFGKFGVGRVGVRLGFVEGGGGAVALDEVGWGNWVVQEFAGGGFGGGEV